MPFAQRRDVLHGAGLVVDGHAGGQHRVFVDLGQEFLRVNASVRPGHDLDDGEALVLQRADGALHAGVFKTRDDDFIAPVLTRAGRAGHGHVVALTAAGREVDFIAAAVQRFGYAGAGRGNGILRGNGGVIQAAGVGPKLSQRLADSLRHRRVHPGRGGVIKIMQLGVGKHSTHSSHYCTKLYRLNYTRSPSKNNIQKQKGLPRGKLAAKRTDEGRVHPDCPFTGCNSVGAGHARPAASANVRLWEGRRPHAALPGGIPLIRNTGRLAPHPALRGHLQSTR